MPKKKSSLDRTPLRLTLWLTLLLLQFLPTGIAGAEERPLRIGVLSIRGAEQCLKSWSPTAEYLATKIPNRTFTIVPLAHPQIDPSVKNREVDFILTNSSLYVELEEHYGVNRIATLKELRLGRAYSHYGSVIFTKATGTAIRTIDDLKGKSFMAVSEWSLGGWQMAWRELKEKGIDPHRDFKSLQFGETHDNVVFAVRDGLVAAGSVRTDTLETMAAEGKIVLSDYFAIPRLHDQERKTPYLCSTREYPDWPIAKVGDTPDELAEQVAVALLEMRPDSVAAVAANCAGWTIPANYQSVRELMMALRLGPYKDLGKVTITDVLRHYWFWILLGFLFFCSHLVFTSLVMKLNRQIKASHQLLSAEIEMHKQLDKDLEKARQQAEAATLAKSQFLANMSHEIRTPMNGIVAATDLALAETVSPEVEHYLHIVQNSSSALLGIINDILDFSKIEAGQLELKERIFRLDEMFDRLIDVFINQAAEKDIELLVDIDTHTPRVLFGDALRLQQILTNLIGNSLKFTGPNGIILVSVKDISQDTEGLGEEEVMLAFAVKDTGTGIPGDFLPLLFEPFTQGDASSTRKYEGTGLGLSITKKFVTMMHGTITVNSIVGQGSTFSFTVRLGKKAAPAISRFVFPPDIAGLNVLVVDDCRDSRVIMAKILISLGFEVETVASGLEAINRLQGNDHQDRKPIELTLMDWKMAELDGIATSRKIREDLHLTMPIIMMTAFAREVHRSTAEKVGINGFLTKPIFQSTLFDAIMDAFGKEGLHKIGESLSFTTKASMYKKQLKGCRLLVAEDNLTNQQVARAILGGAGILVTMVNNGQEAVNEVQRTIFDGILMDVQMPIMNGYDATRKIRQLPGCETLPIIAMTAHALKGDEEKCLEAGMDGYVTKPIHQDRLFYTIWRRLHSRQRVAAAIDEDDILLPDTGEPYDQALFPEAPTGQTQQLEVGQQFDFQIPGIDVGAVLRSTGISWQTFQDILTGFLHDNHDTVLRLEQARTAKDYPALMQLAHSIKGSAANIGAGELREAADQLEQGCGAPQSDDDIRIFCEEVQRELTRLQGVIAQLTTVASAPETSGTALASKADIVLLLTQLTEAIDRADPEEIKGLTAEVLRQLGARHLVGQASLDALLMETSRYDYDKALKTIENLRKSVEEHT